MAKMAVGSSFLLRVRVERGRVVLELQELRSGRIHRFDGARALWRFLQGRLPGLH